MTRRRILVPIDFSPQSDFALEYARLIASSLDALITCMYVIEDQKSLADKNTVNEFKHKLRREAEGKLSERVNQILNKEENIPFELIVTSGNVQHKVLEKSIDLNAQMIVIGRSGSSQKRTTRIGSNAEKIVSKSLVPVVVVNRRRMGKHKHLILPLDLEKAYSDKLSGAIEIASALDAFVSVIAVTEKERSGLRPVYLKKLKEIAHSFGAKNVFCDTHLLESQSTISSEIISFSESIEDGIILLTTHHDKNAKRPYLGFMETEVLSRTEVPVLFLNPRSTIRLSFYNSGQYNHPTFPSVVPMGDPFF